MGFWPTWNGYKRHYKKADFHGENVFLKTFVLTGYNDCKQILRFRTNPLINITQLP